MNPINLNINIKSVPKSQRNGKDGAGASIIAGTTQIYTDGKAIAALQPYLDKKLDVSKFDSFFELKSDINGKKYIEAKFDFASIGGLTAHAKGSAMVPSLWDAAPLATTTNFGVVKIGTGITIVDGVISVNTDEFDMNNYFDKVASDSRYAYKQHNHTKSEIADFPTSMPASDVYDWAKSAAKPAYNFGEIGEKPTTIGGYGITDAWTKIDQDRRYAYKLHNHMKAEIADFPTSMPASDVYDWAKATAKPSYSKNEIGLDNVDNIADINKSVKYATSADISNKLSQSTNRAQITGTVRHEAGMRLAGVYVNGYRFSYGNTIQMQGPLFGSELAFDCLGGGGATGTGSLWFRTQSDWGTSEWGEWKKLYDESNINRNDVDLIGRNITASGSLAANSDRRLKTNILRLSSAMDKLTALSGYTYKKRGIVEAGLIAQEVRSVLPEAVIGIEAPNQYLSLNYNGVIALLVEAIKELNHKIESK